MKATVIIPTFKKEHFLNRTLASFLQQSIPSQKIEILIVDNANRYETKKVVEFWKEYLNVKYFRSIKAGRSSARNLGISNASNDILIFIDDDMIVPPNFIYEHLSIHEKHKKVVVIGYRYLINYNFYEFRNYVNPVNITTCFENIQTLPYIYDDREYIYKNYGDDLRKLPTPWITLYSNNFSLEKKWLDKAGYFCEEFQKKWGVEDIELGYRLWKKGLKFILSRKAAGYHQYHKVNWKKNQKDHKDNLCLFFKKYANVDIELYSECFRTGLKGYINEMIKYRKQSKILPYGKLNGNEIKFLKDNSSGKTLLVGYGNGSISREIKINVAYDTNYSLFHNNEAIFKKSDGTLIRNLLGIHTDYKDKYFDTAVISNIISYISPFYVGLLFKESFRTSKKVIYAGNAAIIKKILKKLNYYNSDNLLTLERSIAYWLETLNIENKYLHVRMEDGKLYMIINHNIGNPIRSLLLKRPKISISIDFEKINDWTNNGVELGFALKKKGCHIRFVNARQKIGYKTALQDINWGKTYLSLSQMRLAKEMLSPNECAFNDEYFEIPFSRPTSASEYKIDWLNIDYIGLLPSAFVNAMNDNSYAIWCFSDLVKRNLIDNGGNSKKIFVIPMGVNANIYYPNVKIINQKCGYEFMTMGLPFKSSGIDVVIKSFIDEFREEENVSLRVIFLPPKIAEIENFLFSKNIFGRLKKYQNQYKIIYEHNINSFISKYSSTSNNRRKILFNTHSKNINKRILYMNRCNCYVQAHRSDFVGTKIMQAMACNKPVIVTDKMLPENLCNNTNSFLIKSKYQSAVTDEINPFSDYSFWAEPNLSHLKALMRYGYEDKEEAEKRGNQAREHVINNWTWDNTASKVIEGLTEIYQEIREHRVKNKKEIDLEYSKYKMFCELHKRNLLHTEE